jgi:hypothetical protein
VTAAPFAPKQATLDDFLALLSDRHWTGTVHLDLKDGVVKEARLQTEQRVKLQVNSELRGNDCPG